MISLVVATINRPEKVTVCIESALKQSGDYEIIVVDQGDGNTVYPENRRLRVVYSNGIGLSHARNVGFQNALGDLVAYVDDDAIIGAGYFDMLERVFSDEGIAGIAGRVMLKDADRSYAKSQKNESRFLRQNEWSCFLGGNFALRRSIMEEVGFFDERFGLGTEWASGEETDYFLRMCYSGKKVFYTAELIIYHPLETEGHSEKSLNERFYSYGKGYGALFAKHLIEYQKIKYVIYFIWELIKPSIRILQYLLIWRLFQVKLNYTITCGRWNGFYSFFRENQKV